MKNVDPTKISRDYHTPTDCTRKGGKSEIIAQIIEVFPSLL